MPYDPQLTPYAEISIIIFEIALITLIIADATTPPDHDLNTTYRVLAVLLPAASAAIFWPAILAAALVMLCLFLIALITS